MTWQTQPLASWDTETTGTSTETDRIVTSALVLYRPGGQHTIRTWMADPQIEIPQAAQRVHGISTEKARSEGRPAGEVIEEITAELAAQLDAGRPLVVYHAPYDLTLLDRECRRHGLKTLDERLGRPVGPVIDPLVIDRYADRYRKGSRKLEAVAAHYGVSLTAAHTADADAMAAVQVAVALAEWFPNVQIDPQQLHDRQIGWAQKQAVAYQAYKRRTDPTFVTDGRWPLIPAPDLAATT